MSFLGDVFSVASAPITGGASLLGLNENTMARVPVLGALTGSQTDAQKQLIEKQRQLAEEAKKREQQNARARMQALGQSMLAFNPQNQLMAQMFGPDAAFTPQQFAQMAADPRVAGQQWGTGSDQDRINQVQDRQRRQQVEQQMRPLPQGPAPLGPRAAPAQARRF